MNTNTLTRFLGRTGLKIKKHSPEIMVVAGCVGVVASAVLACKATTKVNGIIEPTKEQINKINSAEKRIHAGETVELSTGGEYTLEDVKKDKILIYRDAGLGFVKLYGPSVLLGALSLTSILAGHNITRKRNLALAAAYMSVDTSFKEYRNRVVDRFGKELDRELRHNVKSEDIEETVTDEDGKETTVKKTVSVVSDITESDYAKFFDEGSYAWTKDPELNLCFLKQQQEYANHLLQSQGFLFLNDVYKMLGIDVTRAGQEVGWIYDESEDHKGDNYVDFGIYNVHYKPSRDFVNGRERVVLINPNVDGYILDRI